MTTTELAKQVNIIWDETDNVTHTYEEHQDLFINGTIARLGANILWKLFREAVITHHGAYLNLETMKTNPIII